MKILVTGGCGFIGTHLTIALQKLGHDVLIMDWRPRRLSYEAQVAGDVKDAKAWDLAMSRNPEIVFHLAAETGTSQSMTEANLHCSTNVCGTAQLLDSLNRHKSVRKIVLASSRAVYGTGWNIEDQPTVPISVYGLTKLAQEQLLTIASPVPYNIFRFQNVYGPGQSMTNPYTGLVSIFTAKMLKGETVEIYDKGKPSRDFVFVSDVVDALLLSLGDIGDKNIFNVGTGSTATVAYVASLLKKLTESKSEIRFTDYHRPGDVINIESNASKIKALGWEPKVPLYYGLMQFVESIKK